MPHIARKGRSPSAGRKATGRTPISRSATASHSTEASKGERKPRRKGGDSKQDLLKTNVNYEALAPLRTPTQIRSRATVDAILDAAIVILRDEGIDGFTTNKVATKAGVSIGSLYQYYANKEALITAIVLRVHGEVDRRILDAMASVHGDLEMGIDRILTEVMRQRLEDPRLYRALDAFVPRLAPHSDVVAFFDQYTIKLLEAYLTAHQDRLAVDDTSAAAFLLLHTIQPLSQRLASLPVGDPRLAAVTRELKTMLQRYLLQGHATPAARTR